MRPGPGNEKHYSRSNVDEFIEIVRGIADQYVRENSEDFGEAY